MGGGGGGGGGRCAWSLAAARRWPWSRAFTVELLGAARHVLHRLQRLLKSREVRRDCCWGPCTHQRRQAPSAERVVLAHQPRDGLLALVVGRDPGAVDYRRALHVRADPLPKGGEPLLQPPARGGRRIGARASGSPPLSAHAAATHPPPPHLREDGAERLRRAAVPRRLAKQAQPPVRLDPNFDHVRRVGERARCARTVAAPTVRDRVFSKALVGGYSSYRA